MRNFLRIFLFMIFFGVGLGAVYISFICDELIVHYDNLRVLDEQEKTLGVLKSLIADYEYSLERIKNDPNYTARLGPRVLGADRPDSDTLYPELSEEQLEAAKRVLAKTSDGQGEKTVLPVWLLRCSEKYNRLILLVCGAFLVLISLIWFAWSGRAAEKKRVLLPPQDIEEKKVDNFTDTGDSLE